MGIKTPFLEESVLKCRKHLEPRDQFQVDQPRGEALRQRVGSVGEILDQQVGDGILSVDEIEDFEGSPDILQATEGIIYRYPGEEY